MKSVKHALLCAAIAVGCLPQAVNPAAAQSDPAKSQLLTTLERLAAAPPSVGEPVVTRAASISVTGTIRIVSRGLGPLFCSLQFFYFDPNTRVSHSEFATSPVAIAGNLGTCNIVVPFKWENVTDSTENVGIFVGVGNGGATPVERAVAQSFRGSQFAGPSLPLGPEGADSHFTFNIRI